jgi:hypothetical protein
VERRDVTEQAAAAVQWWPPPPAPDHLQFHVLVSEKNSDPSIIVDDMAGAVGCIRFGSRWSVSVLATTVPLSDQEQALIEQEREKARAENAENAINWGVVEDDGTPHLIDL